MSTLAELWDSVRIQCTTKQTGSYFLSSPANKPGQIVIRDGQLVSIVYAGLFGEQAFTTLAQLDSIKFSFASGVEFPTPLELTKEDSETIMWAINIPPSSNIPDTPITQPDNDDAPSDAPEYVEITYRGQKVRRLKTSDSSATSSKKPTRIYRGQRVLDDE